MALQYVSSGNVEGPSQGGYLGPWRFPGVSVESAAGGNATKLVGTSTYEKTAQSFQLSSQTDVTGLVLSVGRVGAPTDSLRVGIQADSSGEPSGTFLASATLGYLLLYTGSQKRLFEFSAPITLSASTTYWIVVERTGSLNDSNYFTVFASTTDNYANGAPYYLDDGSWTAYGVGDVGFQILDDTETFFCVGVNVTNNYTLRVYKSSSPTSGSWTQAGTTDFTYPITGIGTYVETYPETGQQYGSLLHIAAQTYNSGDKSRPAALFYLSFDLAASAWVTNYDTVETPSLDDDYTAAGRCCITVRGATGLIIIMYQDDGEKVGGAYYGRVSYAYKALGGSWTTSVALDGGGSTNNFFPYAVEKGSNDRIHFVFYYGTYVYQRTLSSTLESLPSSRSAVVTPCYPGRGCSFDDSGTQRVKVPCIASDGGYKAHIFEFTSSDNPGQLPVPTSVGDIDMSANDVPPFVTNDDTDVYTLYQCGSAGSYPYDIYYDLNDGTDVEIDTTLSNYDIINATVYTRGGSKYLAFLVHNQYGSLRYGEVALVSGQSISADPATLKANAVTVAPSLGSLSVAANPATIKLQGVTVTPTIAGQEIQAYPAQFSAAGVSVGATVGELAKLASAVTLKLNGISTAPSFGSLSKQTNAVTVKHQAVTTVPSIGALQLTPNPAIPLLSALPVAISVGGISQQATPVTIRSLANSVSVTAGALSKAVTPVSSKWQAVQVDVSYASPPIDVNSAIAKILGVSTSPVFGAFSKSVLPATASLDGVQTVPSFGGFVVQANPSTISLGSVPVTPAVGGVNIGTNPAVNRWQGVIVGKSYGALTKATNAAVARLLGVTVTPSTGGQFVSADPATLAANSVLVTPVVGSFSKSIAAAVLAANGVAVTPSAGPLSQGISPALGFIQGISTGPVVGGVAIGTNPSTLVASGVQVSPLLGSLLKTALPAILTIEGIEVVPASTGAIVQANPALSKLLGVQVNPVPGAISIPADPAQASAQAVAVQAFLGALQKAAGPAGITITAQNAPVILGTLEKAVGTASGTWEGITVVPDIPMIYVGRSVQAAWDIFQLVTLDLDTLWSIQSLVAPGPSTYYHQKALTKIKKDGEAVTLTYTQKGIHNPLTGTFGPSTTITIPGWGVEVPSTPEEYEENELSPIDTTKIFFVPLVRGVTIPLRSKMFWAGTERELAAFTPYRPDGALIAADLFLEHPDTTNTDSGSDIHITEWSKIVRRVKAKGADATFEHGLHADVTGWVVEIPGNPEEYENLELQDKSPVTLMFVPATRGVRPVLGSTLTWDNRKRTVKGVVPIRPAGITIAAKVVLA